MDNSRADEPERKHCVYHHGGDGGVSRRYQGVRTMGLLGHPAALDIRARPSWYVCPALSLLFISRNS